MKRTVTAKATGIAAASLAALFALGACGSDDDPAAEEEMTSEDAMTQEATGDEAESPSEDMAVPELLDFTATTIDGEDFEGASTLGDPTVLWFWEHDCPVCQSQGPAVAALVEEYGDEIDVVGVSGAGLYAASGAEDRAGFVDQTGTGDAVHIEDQDYAIRTAFEVVSQSTYVVLDSEGAVLESGSLSEDDLNAAVESAM
ncbi:redoxin domain-containing protein [Glycomyces buryatensis]|uniref:redoxin domain-containing protein n=1 Tax=Glycomyces buryatensis TaxID=2570927 RepID=UPI0014562AA0|nr:redoxin domain-containing protein [Glycomyces buryatensis]